MTRLTVRFVQISGDDGNNLSNSTLRRKLFEGAVDDDCNQSDDEIENMHCTPENDSKRTPENPNKISKITANQENMSPKSPNMCVQSYVDSKTQQFDSNEKENYQHVNVNITPGAMILTPNAKSVGPTPDRSVSIIFSISLIGVRIRCRTSCCLTNNINFMFICS